MRIIILILIFFLPLTLSAQEFNFVFEPEAFPLDVCRPEKSPENYTKTPSEEICDQSVTAKIA